jgi:hypothetical protein
VKEAIPMADNDTPQAHSRLTPLEDAELRQLIWFGLAGDLSEKTLERIEELRARDRRTEVRDPRPDPVSQDSNGRRYISDSEGEAKPDAERQLNPVVSCSNCGYLPVEPGSLCPHCAVRAARSA